MDIRQLEPGDMVFAATNITNDGSHPELSDETLIAASGTRGVIINVGHLEADPNQALLLVRFEQMDGELGPPTGCWPEELTHAEVKDLLLAAPAP